MGAWTDFLLTALALAAGWLGWVLLRVAQIRPQPRRPAPAPTTSRSVIKAQAVDSEL
jgi:hypothetical protein